jgi:hypothetical protein
MVGEKDESLDLGRAAPYPLDARWPLMIPATQLLARCCRNVEFRQTKLPLEMEAHGAPRSIQNKVLMPISESACRALLLNEGGDHTN